MVVEHDVPCVVGKCPVHRHNTGLAGHPKLAERQQWDAVGGEVPEQGQKGLGARLETQNLHRRVEQRRADAEIPD